MSDKFGLPAKTDAPPKRTPDPTEPVSVLLPAHSLAGIMLEARRVTMAFNDASILHYELGQDLARLLRQRDGV